MPEFCKAVDNMATPVLLLAACISHKCSSAKDLEAIRRCILIYFADWRIRLPQRLVGQSQRILICTANATITLKKAWDRWRRQRGVRIMIPCMGAGKWAKITDRRWVLKYGTGQSFANFSHAIPRPGEIATDLVTSSALWLRRKVHQEKRPVYSELE